MVVAGEVPAVDAVELAVAQHELLVLVLAPVVPQRGGRLGLEERAVGDVAPAARADEVDGAAEMAARVVVAADVAAPQRDGVGAFAEDVAVDDDRAVAARRGSRTRAGRRRRACF